MHRMLPFIGSPTQPNLAKQETTQESKPNKLPPATHQERSWEETMGRSSLLATLLVAVAAVSLHGALPVGGSTAAAPIDTVADSCDAIRDFVDYAFCTAALRSSPGASTADRHGHLLIAADLAVARGTSARDAVSALARGERDPAARDGLEACGILYGTSVPALQFMRGYAAARSWEAARSLLSLTGQAGIGCEAALGAPEAAARMAGANREFEQLTTMATALLNKVS